MTVLYTILAILLILFIVYKFYTDFLFLTKKKRKYNKSVDATNWYRSTRPFDQFLYGKADDHKYKILKEEEDNDQDSKETQS